MKLKIFIVLIFSFLCSNSYSSEKLATDTVEKKKIEFDLKTDLYESIVWSYKGSYLQFKERQNLYFAGAALLSTLYFIRNDHKISQKTVRKNKNEKIFRLISDSSILFNTPIIPFLFYRVGVANNDEHMVQFSKEYFSALLLSLAETEIISAIPVHQRPDHRDLSFWEKAFRGQSSFPSGHVVGYTVLGFKTLQFYGPYYALTPLLFAAATGFERIHSEKHYASDVIASGFISFLASEGVRYTANYKKNHPIYNWIFEHKFSLNYIRRDDAPGLLLSFSF